MPKNLKMNPEKLGSRDNIHLLATKDVKGTEAKDAGFSAAPYIALWIFLSSAVILHNKYLLYTTKFTFPMLLTSWHLIFATLMTQCLSHTSIMSGNLAQIKMTPKTYLYKVVPIAVFFSISLIFSNQAYLYLSVSFIQMLKAFTPIAVLFASVMVGVSKFEWKTFTSIAVIVVGIALTTVGELEFVPYGVFIQVLGICCEATRLVLVQKLLKDLKMDALTSLYYFAPACATLNFVAFLIFEFPSFELSKIEQAGKISLLFNATVAFSLNIAVVMLIRKTSSLVVTLSGVIKDILLVVLSMLLFGNPVTGLQFFGYGIALVGLTAYKSGGLPSTKEEYQTLAKQYINRNRLITCGLLIGWCVYLFVPKTPKGDAQISTE